MNRHDEMRQKVIQFHKKNPKVMELFDRFTRELISRGFQNYSVNGIFERIRWETAEADSEGGTKFKLSNNHRPFYARAWMKMNPEYDGFFRTRKQTSEQEPATKMKELGPEYFNQQRL